MRATELNSIKESAGDERRRISKVMLQEAIDMVVLETKKMMDDMGSRELSIVMTKLQEAGMWAQLIK